MAVNRVGHFARAAEACHVSQPTLSMQIQKLEEDLGAVIFDRSKKPVLLTDIGKKLVEQIQVALFEFKKIEGIVSSQDKGCTSGELSLGVIPTVAPYLLPKMLAMLDMLFPEVRVRIFEMQTHQIIDALNTDSLDAGLLATPLNLPKIFEHALFYEPFYVLSKKGEELSEQKKVKYSSLSMEKVWLLEEGHCLRNQIIDICAAKKDRNFSRKYNFESGSLETLKNLVDQYGGYTLLPRLAIGTIGPNSSLIPFDRPIPAREIGLVYRREHHKTELIEAISEAILQSIPESVRKLRQKDLNILPVDGEKI